MWAEDLVEVFAIAWRSESEGIIVLVAIVWPPSIRIVQSGQSLGRRSCCRNGALDDGRLVFAVPA